MSGGRELDRRPGGLAAVGAAPLAAQRQQLGPLAFAWKLYRQDSTFRGFLDFAVIGALVLLFLHPHGPLAALGLSSAWQPDRSQPAAIRELSHGEPPTSLDEMLRRRPMPPVPRGMAIDRSLFAGSSSDSRLALESAADAYESGDPAEATELLAPLDQGDPNVMALLGLARMGRPNADSQLRGVGLLEAAAAAGHRQAMAYLGMLLIMAPPGMAGDRQRGAALLQRAADQGDAEAALRLGLAYGNGFTGTIDTALAVRYLRMAAGTGNAEAAFALSAYAWDGRGMARDEGLALRLLEEAASRGHVQAQVAFGLHHLNQFIGGWLSDPGEAVRWLERAAAGGAPEAMHLLGRIKVEHGREAPWLDPEAGIALFRRCAALRHSPCLFAYGEALQRGLGVAADPVEAYAYYDAALRESPPQDQARGRLEALRQGLDAEEIAQATARATELLR